MVCQLSPPRWWGHASTGGDILAFFTCQYKIFLSATLIVYTCSYKSMTLHSFFRSNVDITFFLER